MKVKYHLYLNEFIWLSILEINQQILDAQSALIATNNSDNGPDIGIQRSRSSITRTLLMNLGKSKKDLQLILLLIFRAN